MAAHRLFLLGVQRENAAKVVAALRAQGHPCESDVERRIVGGDVEQALLVAQSDEIAGLRALQDSLTALGCAAFISESSSWRTRVWESVKGTGKGDTGLFNAKVKAALVVVGVLLALVGAMGALATLGAGRPHETGDSPIGRLTDTREGPRVARNGDESPETTAVRRDAPAPAARAGATGATTGADEVEREGDTAAMLFEWGALAGGLLVGLAAAIVALRKAPLPLVRRGFQGLGVALFAVGVWAASRPREFDRSTRVVRDTHADVLAVSGVETDIHIADGATERDDGDAGATRDDDGGVTDSRPLRGPFDRFVRRLSGTVSHLPAPSYATILATLRERAAADVAITTPPSAPAPSGEREGRHHRGHHAHGGHHGHHSATSDAADASATVTVLDAAAPVDVAAPRTVASATVARTPSTTRRPAQRAAIQFPGARGSTTVVTASVHPRLGGWFVLGVAVGLMIAARPRPKAEERS